MEAADGLVAAVDRVFLDEPSGSYRTSADEYRQTPNLLAVGMGFVASHRVDRVVASVVADVEARDRHHNVGHIGARYLMPVLAGHGHAQLALDVLRRDGTPGWKQWLDQGHLTFMEMWDKPRSSCHYFHGTPAIWLYEGLVGLKRGADGWQRFTVTPQLDTDVHPGRACAGVRDEDTSSSTGTATAARSRSRCRPGRRPSSGCPVEPSELTRGHDLHRSGLSSTPDVLAALTTQQDQSETPGSLDSPGDAGKLRAQAGIFRYGSLYETRIAYPL